MRRINAVLACLMLLSGTAFAQVPEPIDDDTPTLVNAESAHLFLVDGKVLASGKGVYLNENAALIISQKLESYKAENASLKADYAASVPMLRVVVFVAAGVLIGAGGGYLIAKNVK